MIFCFDIDNTIYSHNTMELTDRTLKALRELQAKGHLVILASGRDLSANMSRHLVDAVQPDGLVHCNGLHASLHGESIFEHYFDKEKMREILEYADEHGMVFGAFTNAGTYFTHVDRMPESGRGYLRNTRVMGEEDREEFIAQPVIAMSYLGAEEGVKRMQQDLGGIYYYMFSGNGGADVLDINMAKADGIEKIQSIVGLGWKDTVCFGDSMNDVEMIRRAGRGIAVANAVDAVRKVADLIVPGVDDEGVASYLEREFLND